MYPSRFLGKIMFVLAVLIMAAGCGGKAAEKADPETLRFVTVFPANTTDPHLCYTAFVFNSGAFETLVGLDVKTLKMYPWLAEKWETEDGQNWDFTIREGIRFHNGKEMTAERVKASLERSIKLNPGMKTALKIETIEVDGRHIHIKTETPYPSLISSLVHFNTVIMDVEAPEDSMPIGTGAFRFVKFDPTANAELVKYDDYWGEKAHINRVIMSANQDANARILMLQAGDADIIYRPALESLEALRKDSHFVVESMKGTRVYHLLYNYSGENRDLWNNKEFRKGIDALVDRESIIKTVMGGEAAIAYGPFSGDYPFSPNSAAHEFGVDAARRHFEAAGLQYVNGKLFNGGNPVKLRIATYIARPELPQIAQVVQDQCRQAGLDMEIHVAENIDEFLPSGKWDVATFSLLSISRGDGAFFLNSGFAPNGTQNYGRLNNQELNTLLEEFNRTVDEEKRNALARYMAELIEDNAYNCYITVPYETAAYRKGISGWNTPANEFEFQMITKELSIDN